MNAISRVDLPPFIIFTTRNIFFIAAGINEAREEMKTKGATCVGVEVIAKLSQLIFSPLPVL